MPASIEPTYETLRGAYLAVHAAAIAVSDSLRIGAPWAGLAGSRPRLIELSAIEIDSGVSVDLRYLADEPTPLILPPGTVAGPEDIGSWLTKGGADVTDLLLSQARYFSHWVCDPQPALGVLLAAIACEVRGKATLLDAATDPMRPQLEADLRNVHPTVGIFDRYAKKHIGRSLRDDEPDLFRRLEDLFTARNRVAHQADHPVVGQAADLVRTAMEVIEWCDSASRNDRARGSQLPPASLPL